MDGVSMEGTYGPEIDLDLCFPCHVLWLDKRESLQLSPRGTLDLFKVIYDHRDDPRHSLQSRIECPRCGRRLSLNQDIGKGGRFSYHSCPAGDGRLTPFSEFLKEKQFVRSLNPAEQSRLRAEVKHVQCSRCGAPVDLARGFACDHCGSPLSVLDKDAVEKTLRELQAAEAQRAGDPREKEMQARALAAMEGMRTHADDYLNKSTLTRPRFGGNLGIDLLSASIGMIFGDF
jgi:DNA-directed RNA polymerase subunit RPC12/RpoP